VLRGRSDLGGGGGERLLPTRLAWSQRVCLEIQIPNKLRVLAVIVLVLVIASLYVESLSKRHKHRGRTEATAPGQIPTVGLRIHIDIAILHNPVWPRLPPTFSSPLQQIVTMNPLCLYHSGVSTTRYFPVTDLAARPVSEGTTNCHDKGGCQTATGRNGCSVSMSLFIARKNREDKAQSPVFALPRDKELWAQ
jgi:hypothetical protein